MAKRILFWSVLAMVMLAMTTAYAGTKLAPIPENYRLITGYEPFPDMNYEPALILRVKLWVPHSMIINPTARRGTGRLSIFSGEYISSG